MHGGRRLCIRVRAGLVLSTVVATAACAGSTTTGDDHSGAAPATTSASASAERGTEPGTASPAPAGSASVHPVSTVVVTDDPDVAGADGAGDGTWIEHLSQGLEDAGGPMAAIPAAVAGAGFAPSAPGAPSFADLVVDTVGHSTQLVIFFETDLAAADAGSVRAGALEAFDAVERAAPDGRVVMVAPYRFSPEASEPSAVVRQALREAADRSAVTVDYVDPVAEGWPPATGGQQFADALQLRIVELVMALSRSGAFD